MDQGTSGARTIHPSKSLIAALAFALSALPVCRPLEAQTLARPGWAGSGITPQTWSKHAVFYRIDTATFQDSTGDGIGDLKGITQRLDYLRSLGVDAILLESLAPTAPAPVGSHPPLIDPALGTLDDLDDLSLAASRLGIRILLDLPNPDPALARFWLTRGLAGFRIPAKSPSGQPNDTAIQAIRKLLPSYVGQRVLITDAPSPDSAPGTAKPSLNDLLLDTDLLRLPSPSTPDSAATTTLAGQLRAALEHSQSHVPAGLPLIATDAPGLPSALNRFADDGIRHTAEISRILAAVLLLTRTNPILDAGQELALASPSGNPSPIPWGAPPPPPPSSEPPAAAAPAPAKPVQPPVPPPTTDRYVPYVPPTKAVVKPAPAIPPDPASAAGQDLDPASVLNFYRQLSQLHHGNTAIRDGDQTFLNYDGLNALIWVRKPAAPSLHNPPVIILCNLSDKPLTVALKPDLLRLGLRGSFLKTVLRSDGGMGAMDLSPVHIPPFGVYIGELKF